MCGRSPGSPARGCVDRRSQSLAGHYSSSGRSRLAHNGHTGKLAMLRPALSLEAPLPVIQPLPRIFLDLSIEGIKVRGTPLSLFMYILLVTYYNIKFVTVLVIFSEALYTSLCVVIEVVRQKCSRRVIVTPCICLRHRQERGSHYVKGCRVLTKTE